MTSREYEVAIRVLHDRIAQSIKAAELFDGKISIPVLNEFRMGFTKNCKSCGKAQ